MKRLSVLSLAILLVFAASSVGLANQNEVTFDVEMYIPAYFEIGTIDANGVPFNRLFADTPTGISGEPGLYISDGNATRTFAKDVWGLDESDVVTPYSDDGTLDGADGPRVAKFYVDANTAVSVTLSAPDWSGWANTPTLFRISSGPHPNLTFAPYGPSWDTTYAEIYNTVYGGNVPQDSPFKTEFENHNALSDEPSFTVEFRESEGPFEFHINGAMWLPKIGQVAGDTTYDVELVVTVEQLDGYEKEVH